MMQRLRPQPLTRTSSLEGRGRRARARGVLTALVLLAFYSTGCVYGQSQPSVTVSPVTSSPSNILLVIDGKVIEAESLQIQRGQHVMVWVRDLEKLGWGSIEPGQPDQVCFKGRGVTLTFTKERGRALVNSLSVILPIDTYLRDGKLMVPISFVAKALGYDYDCTYKAVATITTSPAKPVVRSGGSIEGRLLFNGRGVCGVIVQAVQADYTVIKGAAAKTDAEGAYRIDGLPEGECMAYVYVGDNPQYFNRTSELANVVDGAAIKLKPISLGKVLAPLSPGVGERSVPVVGGKISFKWTPCEGAASYSLEVKRRGTSDVVFSTTTDRASIQVPASRFAHGAQYEAQVTALDAKGEFLGGTAGAGGAAWTFTIERSRTGAET